MVSPSLYVTRVYHLRQFLPIVTGVFSWGLRSWGRRTRARSWPGSARRCTPPSRSAHRSAPRCMPPTALRRSRSRRRWSRSAPCCSLDRAAAPRPRFVHLIGVGTTDEVAPPSEPSRPISGTRLSSWWLAFKKIGKPQHALVLRRTSQPR